MRPSRQSAVCCGIRTVHFLLVSQSAQWQAHSIYSKKSVMEKHYCYVGYCSSSRMDKKGGAEEELEESCKAFDPYSLPEVFTAIWC